MKDFKIMKEKDFIVVEKIAKSKLNYFLWFRLLRIHNIFWFTNKDEQKIEKTTIKQIKKEFKLV